MTCPLLFSASDFLKRSERASAPVSDMSTDVASRLTVMGQQRRSLLRTLTQPLLRVSIRLAIVTLAVMTPVMAHATLPEGATAPDFTLNGALGGRLLNFSLHKQLNKGPVVLYFFPAAFTAGCTLEAHAFAEATPAFHAMGAAVVGVTAGNTDRVAEFSKEECRNRFAVLADPGAKVAARYDSQKTQGSFTLSTRTSYVVTPEGQIVLSFTSDDPEAHVQKTLDAVRAWRSTHPTPQHTTAKKP